MSQKEYRKSQFQNIKSESFKHHRYNPKVKFIQAGETKWLDITDEEFKAIQNMLTGEKESFPPKALVDAVTKSDSENFELQASGLFKELDAEEEKEFRADARKIYVAGDEIPVVWHPVYRDECKKINDEMREDGFRKE